MLRFDEVLPTLLRRCEAHPHLLEQVIKAVAVRDLTGRARLVLKLEQGSTLVLEALTRELEDALGGWFAGPVLTPNASSDVLRSAARGILDGSSTWPAGWPKKWLDATGTERDISDKWHAYTRVLNKESWLDGRSCDPPWPLVPQTPALVSFYSFKGGVGRSSALAITALQLARRGKKVLCIDLDLEAPGLDSLFGLTVDRGVIDYLLGYAATGHGDLTGLAQEVTIPDPIRPDGTLRVVPAGALWSDSAPTTYLEKLGRLDFLTDDDGPGPVDSALRALVRAFKQEFALDYILIDSRAGLHDLGGLSLTSLAHVDVIVSRGDHQGGRGLPLILDSVRRRRKASDRRICVVHNFARLPIGAEDNQAEEARFRGRVYQAFLNAKLYVGDDVPDEEDDSKAHNPVVIGAYDEILRSEALARISTAVLENEPFRRLRRRIEELAAREASSDDEIN